MGDFAAALGLSATPEREYDEGFQKYVVPALGPVVFEYGYVQAFEDKVITPFDLVNVQIDFLPHEKEEYDKLTRRAAVLFQKAKIDAGSRTQTEIRPAETGRGVRPGANAHSRRRQYRGRASRDAHHHLP